jgi:DNA polymerase-3 subunit gamma/tau
MSEAQTDKGAKAAAYRVLARKYRPRDFSELIGQEPMVRTLTNAFAAGRIAQAWMLTGVRGVGKTTTARILARALNYKTESVDRPTVDLSVPGEHCQAIMEGRHVDVIEMDAASHTGVDNMRDLLEQVRYAPVAARYKVYIIDEVHMLSGGAFNAMLKTLEEPPPHVKFIFATTEIRKVPITVLSRCQRFDLRRVDAATLGAHLAGIAGREGIEAEDEALSMIARASEGSVRDSLSILDQAIAHGSGSVSAVAVRDMLGLADRGRVIDLFEHLMRGDVAAALAEFKSQYDAGADPASVLTDLAEFTHLVTRIRFVESASADASLTIEERERGAALAGTLSVRVLSRSWQMLLKGIAEVQGAPRPFSAGEMVLIRIAHAASLPTPDEALRMLAGQEGDDGPSAAMSQGRPDTQPQPTARAPLRTAVSPGGGGGSAMRVVEPSTEQAAQPTQRPAPVAEQQPAITIRGIADIVALADANRDMTLKVLIRRCVRPVRIEPGLLDVSLTDDAPKSLLGDLSRKLDAWTGRRWVVSLSREAGEPTLAEIEEAKHQSRLVDARSDPTVAAILSRFPGARIVNVSIPDTAETDAGDAPEPVPDPGIDDDSDDD